MQTWHTFLYVSRNKPAAPMGKIHPVSKMAVTFEPEMQFCCPSEIRKFFNTVTILKFIPKAKKSLQTPEILAKVTDSLLAPGFLLAHGICIYMCVDSEICQL